MGLDVMLCRSKDPDGDTKAREEYERISGEIRVGKDWDAMTDAEKVEYRDQLYTLQLDLDVGEWGGSLAQSLSKPSRLYPEHLFQRGYFRSSYNDAGINSVARGAGIYDLYEIFHVKDHDDEVVIPNWRVSLVRASKALEEARKALPKLDNGWYVQAYEIVVETIEWVLARKDHDEWIYYLSWSA
jgi:hypothetical protein